MEQLESAPATPTVLGGLLSPLITCGLCRACRFGDDAHCEQSQFPGAAGGYAEYLKTSARAVVGIDDSLEPADIAALADAGLTAAEAARRLRAGDRCVVIGAGGLGHIGVQVMKAISAAEVIVVDRHPEAAKLAESIGADHGVVADGTHVDTVLELTRASTPWTNSKARSTISTPETSEGAQFSSLDRPTSKKRPTMLARIKGTVPLALVIGVLAFLWCELALNFTFHWFTNGDLGNGLSLPDGFQLVVPAAFVSWGFFFAAGADMTAFIKVAIGSVTGGLAALGAMAAASATAPAPDFWGIALWVGIFAVALVVLSAAGDRHYVPPRSAPSPASFSGGPPPDWTTGPKTAAALTRSRLSAHRQQPGPALSAESCPPRSGGSGPASPSACCADACSA